MRPEFRVLITGGSDNGNVQTIATQMGIAVAWATSKGKKLIFVIGDCPTGVDAIALLLIRFHDWSYEKHEASDAGSAYSSAVSAGANLAIVFGSPNECSDACKAAGIPVKAVPCG